MKLYRHQQDALDSITKTIEAGERSGLVVMPTGTGKTVMFTMLARTLSWTTLVLVHRDELIQQAHETFRNVYPGATVGIVKAQRNEWNGYDVVIASVQSLHKNRLESIPRKTFKLIIVDEAHHAPANTWKTVLSYFNVRFVLGVTATPERSDGNGLVPIFGETPVYSYDLRQAIEDNRLCRLRQFKVESYADLDKVAVRAGDFAERQLGQTVNTLARNRVVLEAYQAHASERQAVAFCAGVDHAQALARMLQRAGIKAACITGETPLEKRRSILSDFRSRRIRVVTNCAVLTEGFDDPSISCILMARPTKSKLLYTQCIGRGLRKLKDKPDCLVLDFVDNCTRHKLVTVLHLLGAPDADDACGKDIFKVVDRDRTRAERRNARARVEPLQWRASEVCPWPSMPSLEGYVPSGPEDNEPVTSKQLKRITHFRLKPKCRLTVGEARYLLRQARNLDRTYPLPATSKQKYFLRRRRLWRDGMTRREAHKAIGRFMVLHKAS